ncbi:MAG: glycosyltransferase family 4 protein [Candidatus Thorarchaeota archaeon]|nr:glycosyltransferase family 4 protein [Candidatus Thorarchaeota archaeon]
MFKVAYMSSYTPRECGIATFTEDLIKNVDALHTLKPAAIIAMNDPGSFYNYGKEVVMHIDADDERSYRHVADQINSSDIDLINVQHEFGLFGGDWGNYLLTFLRKLNKPCITTMHTTLFPDAKVFSSPESSAAHKKVVKGIGKYSSAIAVMTKMAANILQEHYGVDAAKIRIIPHGTPPIPFVPSDSVKEGLGLDGRTILSTFGLLSRDKGIQNAIKALPATVKEWPDILYLIIGATHPQVRLHEGEKYRKSLVRLVKQLKLEKNVKFHNRFLSKEELIHYLQATDVYICPYVNVDQLSSGTVTYALGAGRAIVSTPFYYAVEVLADGRGVLCKFKSPRSISDGIRQLLQNPDQKAHVEKLAYEYGQEMIWSRVASKYASLFKEMIQ